METNTGGDLQVRSIVCKLPQSKNLVAFAAIVAFALPGTAQAHLPTKPKGPSLEARLASQKENLAHAEYVCKRGAGEHKQWACWAASSVVRKNGQGWLRGERNKTHRLLHPPEPVYDVAYWAGIQIHYAELIGQGGDAGGTDPWPNCPDPYDHAGYSWYDTVACENGGNWLDSPGFYRCGLQFDPMWETHFGRRFCP